jgi:hypothetical protein
VRLVALGLGAAAAGLAANSWAPLWPGALRLDVSGQQRLDPREVAVASGVPLGADLHALDGEGVKRRLRRHTWIREAHVLTLPPATLLIGVEEREPLAVTRVAPQGSAGLVDREGVAFAPAEAAEREGLPLLELTRLPQWEEPDERLRAGLALIRALEAHDLPAAAAIQLEGKPAAAMPRLRLRGQPATVVLGPGNLEGKLDRLGALLGAELPEVAQAEWIDLRFAQRAVLRGEALRTGAQGGRPAADAVAARNREPSG